MDWVSCYVLAWRLSNLLDASFCIEAVEEALRQGRARDLHASQIAGRAGNQHGRLRLASGRTLSHGLSRPRGCLERSYLAKACLMV